MGAAIKARKEDDLGIFPETFLTYPTRVCYKKDMKNKITHKEDLPALRRVEGQVKGIQRMVEGEQYCMDIVNQIHAAVRALYSVSEKVMFRHIEGCVASTFKGGSKADRANKANELMCVIKRLHKQH